MNRKCAYCGDESHLTREHIWPAFFNEKTEPRQFIYNGRVRKFHKGELRISDVCQRCNNEKLSLLDSYLSEIYNQNLKKVISPGESAELNYKYDLLLRVLLKISYNSARAFDSDSDIVKAHKDSLDTYWERQI